MKWYRKAADQGVALSQYILGYRWQVGEVGYGPQRLCIKAWSDESWKIRCGRLAALARASLDAIGND